MFNAAGTTVQAGHGMKVEDMKAGTIQGPLAAASRAACRLGRDAELGIAGG